MIRYLKQEEKNRARAMYEAAFPEDSRAFRDYYFAKKTKDNQILVMEEEEQLQVMIHLNPYIFSVCGEAVKVNYVVAVATDAAVRKQGKMAQVMKQALQDMAAVHQPFTFLMPENYRVYESSGFAFVPGEKYIAYEDLLHIGEGEKEADLQAAEIKKTDKLIFSAAAEQDIPGMVRFSNELLSGEYDIFPEKTENYYRRMMAELASQNGKLVRIERNAEALGQNKRKMIGLFSYGCIPDCEEKEQIEIQEILLIPSERKQFKKMMTSYFGKCPVEITKMDFMVRILDLRVLGLLLRSEAPFSLKVQVQDDIIETNCGCFEIKADKTGSSIAVIPQEEAECSMDIAELTGFLFAKMKFFIREWV